MLSLDRLKYIEGIQKYTRFSVVTTIAIAIVVLTIFIVNQTVIKEKTLSDIPSSPFFSVIIIALLLYCFVFYRIKKRFKRLQELIEQMTEEEFQFLLQAQSSLSFYYKYAPTFVICCDRLYLFTLFEIKEIDPTQITDLDWSYRRNGIFIEFKAPEKIIFTLPKKVLPHFLQIIQQYTNQEF